MRSEGWLGQKHCHRFWAGCGAGFVQLFPPGQGFTAHFTSGSAPDRRDRTCTKESLYFSAEQQRTLNLFYM